MDYRFGGLLIGERVAASVVAQVLADGNEIDEHDDCKEGDGNPIHVGTHGGNIHKECVDDNHQEAELGGT